MVDTRHIEDSISEHPMRWGCGCLTAIVAALTLSFSSCCALNGVEYGNGVRTGMINKVSRKGFIWKTYECQMALEGLASRGEAIGANVWDFSLDGRGGPHSEELAKEMEKYMDSGTKVKISYTQRWTTWQPRGSTDYYVTEVKPVAVSEKPAVVSDSSK